MAGCFRMLTGGGDFFFAVDFSQIDFHLACCEMDGVLFQWLKWTSQQMDVTNKRQTNKQTKLVDSHTRNIHMHLSH